MLRQYELVDRVLDYDPTANEALLNRAYVFSMQAHGSQKRANGDPYFSHPIEVAGILTDLHLDDETIATAILHDTIEDTVATPEEITRLFGPSVARLVDGVTKLSKIEAQTENERAAENLRKFLLAMSDDIRVLLVKLADRLHNMRTLHFIKNPDKRKRIARETMDIYAPLAERIGMYEFMKEMQTLAFAQLEPEAYESITKRLAQLKEGGGDRIAKIGSGLKLLLSRAGIEAEISGREKHPYSIWKKMAERHISFEQLSDIMAFRAIVPTEEACYAALGVIHRRWPMVPGRFKDYISTPKRNGYQSLHTGILGPQNHRIEVQIRTPDMHNVAEHGVAAHWHYKRSNQDYNPPKYKWIQELVGLLDEDAGAEEFFEHTKMDLYHDQVFCFTPRGDLIALPRGATAVDFAYAVHTQIGETCNGVRINGKTRQLATELQNGDQIEILTQSDAKPRAEWESFVKTGRAKSAIRRFTRAQRVTEFSRIGKALIEKTFREHDRPFRTRSLGQSLSAFGVSRVEEVFALVGEDRLSPLRVLEKLHPDIVIDDDRETRDRSRGQTTRSKLKIKGDNAGTAVTIARCCHPLPGEAIVGIFTTGKGITVHKVSCTTLSKFSDAPELWLDVSWEQDSLRTVNGRLNTVLSNEPGSLASLATVISQQGGNISNIHLTDRTPDFFRFELDLEVKDVEHMRAIIAVLQANKYVESVERSDTG